MVMKISEPIYFFLVSMVLLITIFRYWTVDNSHWMHILHTHHPQKLNLCTEIVRNRIISLFCIDGTMTGAQFQTFKGLIIPAFQENEKVLDFVWFQKRLLTMTVKHVLDVEFLSQ